MIFVNFKTYEQGTGQAAVELAKILEEVARETQVKIIPVVQAVDIKEVASSTTLEVWAQKVDPVEFGAHTGSVVPEAVLEDGATGTFLNHSEAKFGTFDELSKAFDRAKDVGLKTLVFAETLEELRNVCSLGPTFVGYESPELIGSTTTSIVEENAEVIKEAYDVSRKAGVPLIVGAGIHNGIEVKKSLELGAVGVAVATDVVKAEDPKQELLELVNGFK